MESRAGWFFRGWKWVKWGYNLQLNGGTWPLITGFSGVHFVEHIRPEARTPVIFLLDRFQVADAIYCYWQQRESWDIFSAAHTMQEAQFSRERLTFPYWKHPWKSPKSKGRCTTKKLKMGDFGQLFCDLGCRGTNNEYRHIEDLSTGFRRGSVGGLVAALLQFVRSYVVRWPQLGHGNQWHNLANCFFCLLVFFPPTTALQKPFFWGVFHFFVAWGSFLLVDQIGLWLMIGFESCEPHVDSFFLRKKMENLGRWMGAIVCL